MLKRLPGGRVAVACQGRLPYPFSFAHQQDLATMNAKLTALVLSLAWLLSGNLSAQEYQDPTPPGIRWGWVGHVQFAINSAALQPRYRDQLRGIAKQMVANPGVSLLLTGHTDNTGDPDYNKRLSQRRNQAVNDFLGAHGVNSYRITQRGVGELRPVANNACDEDRKRNRRVDLAFFPRHRPPPSTGGLVYSPSRPDPNAEAEACAKRPPPARSAIGGGASSGGASGSGTSGGAAGSGSASGTSGNSGAGSSGTAANASGTSNGRSRGGSSPASSHYPGSSAPPPRTGTGSGSPWVNPDDPTPSPGSARSGSSSYGGPGDGGYAPDDEPLPPPPPGGIF